MLENERHSQTDAGINDKIQGTLVTYLRCGGLSITKKERLIAESASEFLLNQ